MYLGKLRNVGQSIAVHFPPIILQLSSSFPLIFLRSLPGFPRDYLPFREQICPKLVRYLSDTCSIKHRTSIGQVLKNYRTYSYATPKVDQRYIGVRLELYWNDIGVLSEIDKTVVVSWLFIGAGNTTCVTFPYLRRKFSIGNWYNFRNNVVTLQPERMWEPTPLIIFEWNK